MKKVVLFLVVGLFSIFAAVGNAVAATEGAYNFQGGGVSVIADAKTSETNISVGGGIGKNFNKFFGVEGSASVINYFANTGAVPVGVAAIGYLPVKDNIDVFAKAGMAYTTVFINGSGTSSASFSGTTGFYSAGVQLNGSDSGLRLSYDHYDLSVVSGLNLKSDGISLSLLTKF